MRILVTGATGQLGARVVAALDGHEVLAPTRAELDLTDPALVASVVAQAPEAIINAAGFTNVDGCERDPEQAFAVNALGVRELAVAATRVDAHVVHVSTDYVFDGRSERPYDEWAPTGPLSEYGRSKLAGERELAAHAPSWTVVRTSWVFGGRGVDLVSWAFAAHDRGELTGVLADQVSIPTYAPDLAQLLVRLAVERRPGLFHATSGAEAVTRHEWITSALRLRGVDPSDIAPLDTTDLDRPAPRPTRTPLDNRALRLSHLPLLRPWRTALTEYVPTWTD